MSSPYACLVDLCKKIQFFQFHTKLFTSRFCNILIVGALNLHVNDFKVSNNFKQEIQPLGVVQTMMFIKRDKATECIPTAVATPYQIFVMDDTYMFIYRKNSFLQPL